jgi:hypothetical protein
MGAGAVEGRLAGSPLVVAPILLGLALRFHPLEDLLAAFLERAQGLVQGLLNRFSRCCGVASQFGLFNHVTLAGDAFFEFTDSLVSLGEKVACVLHRHRSLPQSSSASRFTAGASGFLSNRPSGRSGKLGHDAFKPELASTDCLGVRHGRLRADRDLQALTGKNQVRVTDD